MSMSSQEKGLPFKVRRNSVLTEKQMQQLVRDQKISQIIGAGEDPIVGQTAQDLAVAQQIEIVKAYGLKKASANGSGNKT